MLYFLLWLIAVALLLMSDYWIVILIILSVLWILYGLILLIFGIIIGTVQITGYLIPVILWTILFLLPFWLYFHIYKYLRVKLSQMQLFIILSICSSFILSIIFYMYFSEKIHDNIGLNTWREMTIIYGFPFIFSFMLGYVNYLVGSALFEKKIKNNTHAKKKIIT